eukprot:208457-Rhodomonas_salina.2
MAANFARECSALVRQSNAAALAGRLALASSDSPKRQFLDFLAARPYQVCVRRVYQQRQGGGGDDEVGLAGGLSRVRAVHAGGLGRAGVSLRQGRTVQAGRRSLDGLFSPRGVIPAGSPCN